MFEDGSGAMKVARGRKHKYLGMDLDFLNKHEVRILMCDYVKEIVAAWDKVVDGDGFIPVKKLKTKATIVPKDLFKVDDNIEKLDKETATAFHNIIVKTLFVTKRARPDTSTAIAFLMTRVREPNRDDLKKLQHLMEYL